MTRHICLYAKVSHTRSLGPFTRFALWVQGCLLRCPNCMTPDAQRFKAGNLYAIANLAREILAIDDIEGLTVSGGEPFAQASALATLMDAVRASRDLGLILYSGYRLQELQNMARSDAGIQGLLSRIDLLIDGPYIASSNDNAPLKGSANQNVIFLTDRYLNQQHQYEAGQPRTIELHVDIGEHLLVGIPSARQLDWWQSRKQTV